MRSSLGAVCALAVLATALSAGCQNAPGGVDDDADQDAGPRAPLESGPGAEPGAEDQHALEA
ncbi:hypothetical protein ABZ590_34845, partial [Streptomyces hirsutus]